MEQNNFERQRINSGSRIWSGLFLLSAGFLLLAYKMGAPIPSWIFTWPVLLIVIGLFVGIKSKFHNPGSFIMILIGAIFFVDQSIPGIDFHNYIIPAILIGIGVMFLLRPRGSRCSRHDRWQRKLDRMNGRFGNAQQNFENNSNASSTVNEVFNDNAEYLDVVSVFGGIKKNVQSKNFKGGEVVSFMGGSEINFMQADIQHPVDLEVNNVFGGTKLIIPSNWDVKSEISAVFGGVDDKRNFQNSIPDSNKIIRLKGSCVFGGIEVTNY
ncbi:MAG: LiaF transmembrane domain-containing protein [Ginsengibacter sp.]